MKVSTTSPFFSVALLVISMLSIQCSASLAKSVFPIIGPEATTALRLMFAALVLLPVMRPWRAKLTRPDCALSRELARARDRHALPMHECDAMIDGMEADAAPRLRPPAAIARIAGVGAL